MRVDEGRIIAIEYTVTLGDGEVVETTQRGSPVQYLHGSGQLMPSLEKNLQSLEEGTRKCFTLDATDAYGERDETNVVTLPRSIFPGTVELTVGARLAARTIGGDTYPLTVCEVYSDRVIVDLNHPLAGESLHFDVVVCSVRTAGTDELFVGKPRPLEIV